MTTRSSDLTLNNLAFSFVLQLEWSTADRLIKHDVDAQDDEAEFYDADYDEVKLIESGVALALIMTTMMVMMKITTKRSC